MTGLSDAELMNRIQSADAAAFRELLNRFERKVFGLAWRLTASEADARDLTQDVFLKVWKNPAAWQPAAKLDTWLCRVAYNAFVDMRRREKPTEQLGETLESPADSPEKAILSQSEAERVRKAVDSLPDRQKEALILCYYQDLKAKDAARILGLSQGATEALLFRARQSLKNLLGKEN